MMNSEAGWQDLAKELGVDYLFWGPLEETNYPDSKRNGKKSVPWLPKVTWGRIYDFHLRGSLNPLAGSGNVAAFGLGRSAFTFSVRRFRRWRSKLNGYPLVREAVRRYADTFLPRQHNDLL